MNGRALKARVSLEVMQDKRWIVRESTPAAKTDAAGWFLFEDLPDGNYLVRVYAEGHIGIAYPSAPGRQPSQIALRRAHPISGVVIEQGTDRTISGLQVRARTTKSPAGGTTYVAITDAQGRFEIQPLPEGSYELVVGPRWKDLAESHWTTRQVGVYAGGSRNVRIEAVRGLTISGQIRGTSGAPLDRPLTIEVFALTAHGDVDRSQRRVTKSEGSGQFSVPGLPPGVYHLRFQPTPGDSGLHATATRYAVPAGSENLVVDLAPGAAIVGKVVDERSAPVGPGVLYVHPMGTDFGGHETLAVGVQADGTFRTPMLNVSTSFRLQASGFVGFLQGEQVGVRPGPSGVTLRLRRGGRIRGQVVDERGNGVVAGILVRASATDTAPREAGSHAIAYTKAGGFFEVEPLGPYSFSLQAAGGDSAYTLSTPVTGLRPGSNDVFLRVQIGVELSGRLVDREGNTVKTNYLVADGGPAAPTILSTSRVTAEDGAFVIRGLRAGRVRVRARVGGRLVGLGTFDAPARGLTLRIPE